MKTFNRKSQAAMEFLMTYGWAILVVLVAIAALAYFGVLTPDKFLPTKCQLPAGIACVDHKAATSGVTLILQNGMGVDLKDVTVKVGGDCSATASPSGQRLNNGGQVPYIAGCTLTSGDKQVTSFSIDYANADTGLTHTVNGTLTTRVE